MMARRRARPDELIAFVQGGQTDAVRGLEDRVVGEAVGEMDARFGELQRRSLTAWVTAFGSVGQEAQDAGVLRRILASIRSAVRGLLGPLASRSRRALSRRLTEAVRLGANQHSAFTARATGSPARTPTAQPSQRLRDTAAGIGEAIVRRRDRAMTLLQPAVASRWSRVTAGIGVARSAVSLVRAHVTWTVGQAVHEGLTAGIRAIGARKLWISERDACVSCTAYAGLVADVGDDFPAGLSWDPAQRGRTEAIAAPPRHPNCLIGSVRVAGPIAVVPTDEASGLSPDPSLGCIARGRNARSHPASAVTESVGDFGRSNIWAASVREYVGQVVTIRTASGKELTGTPNHPVATRGGWVTLAELQVGDHVVTSTGAEWEADSIHPDVDHIPPRIEDVSQAFPVGFGPMPLTAKDFHGDGAGSDVYVVRTNGFLRDYGEALGAEVASERHLGGRDVDGRVLLPSKSASREALYGILPAAASGVRGSSESGPFGRLCLAHALEHCLASIAGDHPVAEQTIPNRRAADAEGFCESLLALPGFVATDQVVDVNFDSLQGHVYNLETSEGWYIGNGIVTHNCRCRVVPWKDEWAASGVPPMPDALRREARRSIARGWSLPTESGAARIRAARELLRTGAGLPRSVEEFAALAVHAGHFANRTVPTGP